MTPRRSWLLALVGLVGLGVGTSPVWWVPAQRGTALTVVAHAVARPVLAKLLPAFQQAWQARTGQRVIFRESYGPAGAQTRAILAGLEADILMQNLQSNIDPLVAKGLVRPDWQQRLPHGAVPATTVLVLVTRPGNPKNIRTWNDLTRPDVEVLLMNPKTSGNARWGILAGFGAVQKTAGEVQARAYLHQLLANTRVLVNSGRQATDEFLKNRIGDVMVHFENEVRFLQTVGSPAFAYVVPSPNLRVDFPVTVIDRVVDRRGTRTVAEAFTRFLFSRRAQEIFAAAGYRPVDPQVRPLLPPVERLYTISDFGGWAKVHALLFADGALFDQAQQRVAQQGP